MWLYSHAYSIAAPNRIQKIAIDPFKFGWKRDKAQYFEVKIGD